jgi:hypothetical protein
MNERSGVRLSKQERQELRRLLQSGLQPVRTVLRALALRQLADGQPIRQVAKNVGLTPKTVWLTSQRHQQGAWNGLCTTGRVAGECGVVGWAAATEPRRPGVQSSPFGSPKVISVQRQQRKRVISLGVN